MDFLTIVSLVCFLLGIGILIVCKLLNNLENWLLQSNGGNIKKSKDQDLYEEANPIWKDK